MKKLVIFGVLLTQLFIAGCQQLLPLLQQANVQKPKVKLNQVKLTAFSLKGIDLDFEIGIANPNPFAITLAGFDYQLLIEQNSFLKGEQQKSVKIAARGSSQIDFPLSLSFKELYKTFQSLKNADSIKYTLKTGLLFDLPILGKVRIPLQTTQRLPNLKIPRFGVSALKLSKLTFTGADLQLSVEVQNPNVWSLTVQNFSYAFAVNGRQWLEGRLKRAVTMHGKQKQLIKIPIHLSFIEMGRSVYNLLANPGTLEYRLSGRADVQSSLKFLERFQLPVNQSGSIELLK